jgi:hypothetical protein
LCWVGADTPACARPATMRFRASRRRAEGERVGQSASALAQQRRGGVVVRRCAYSFAARRAAWRARRRLTRCGRALRCALRGAQADPMHMLLVRRCVFGLQRRQWQRRLDAAETLEPFLRCNSTANVLHVAARRSTAAENVIILQTDTGSCLLAWPLRWPPPPRPQARRLADTGSTAARDLALDLSRPPCAPAARHRVSPPGRINVHSTYYCTSVRSSKQTDAPLLPLRGFTAWVSSVSSARLERAGQGCLTVAVLTCSTVS